MNRDIVITLADGSVWLVKREAVINNILGRMNI